MSGGLESLGGDARAATPQLAWHALMAPMTGLDATTTPGIPSPPTEVVRGKTQGCDTQIAILGQRLELARTRGFLCLLPDRLVALVTVSIRYVRARDICLRKIPNHRSALLFAGRHPCALRSSSTTAAGSGRSLCSLLSSIGWFSLRHRRGARRHGVPGPCLAREPDGPDADSERSMGHPTPVDLRSLRPPKLGWRSDVLNGHCQPRTTLRTGTTAGASHTPLLAEPHPMHPLRSTCQAAPPVFSRPPAEPTPHHSMVRRPTGSHHSACYLTTTHQFTDVS